MVTTLSKMLINDDIDENSTVIIDAGKTGELVYQVARQTSHDQKDYLVPIPTTNSPSAKKVKLQPIVRDPDDYEMLDEE